MTDIINIKDKEYCTQVTCEMTDCPHHPSKIPKDFESLRASNLKRKGKCNGRGADSVLLDNGT